MSPPPVALAARDLGLDVHQTGDASSEEALEAMERSEVDLGLVCAFGQFLRAPLLDRLELLNVHPSLLPRWRGAAPIERAIMAGDDRTGVSIIRVTPELDAGPVALCEPVAIEPGDDFGSLSARLAELGGRLAVRALDLRAGGPLEVTEQDEEGMTYAEKIQPGERVVDPGRPAPELERLVRALSPHIGTHLALADGARLGVRRAELASRKVAPGALEAVDGALLLGCEPGTLRITVVRPPGRGDMATAEFLRGNALPRLAE
jgi:methionyl-tRNA formyltransferase